MLTAWARPAPKVLSQGLYGIWAFSLPTPSLFTTLLPKALYRLLAGDATLCVLVH